jgi:hypothetical protein
MLRDRAGKLLCSTRHRRDRSLTARRSRMPTTRSLMREGEDHEQDRRRSTARHRTIFDLRLARTVVEGGLVGHMARARDRYHRLFSLRSWLKPQMDRRDPGQHGLVKRGRNARYQAKGRRHASGQARRQTREQAGGRREARGHAGTQAARADRQGLATGLPSCFPASSVRQKL